MDSRLAATTPLTTSGHELTIELVSFESLDEVIQVVVHNHLGRTVQSATIGKGAMQTVMSLQGLAPPLPIHGAQNMSKTAPSSFHQLLELTERDLQPVAIRTGTSQPKRFLRRCIFIRIMLVRTLSVIVFLCWGISGSGQVVINEFLASNSNGTEDPDFGESSDWLELHNVSPSPLDLSGWFLTDDLSLPNKWPLPSGVSIPTGGFLLIWCDGENVSLDALHTNFKLSADGEDVALHRPDFSLADTFQFGQQATNVSRGRGVDGSPDWNWFNTPTPGASNNTSSAFDGITYGVPTFSSPGGFHEEGLDLELSSLSGTIHYTTDGRAPTGDDPIYASSITLDATTCVRARVIEEGLIPGPVVTHSYFFDPSLAQRPLPVVSLVTNPDHFWDPDTGIYVQDFKPEWEWPVNIEFFENDGNNEAVFNERAGVRINGQNSWILPQKMLGIYFRNAYGNGKLEYPLFHDRDRTQFDSFVLRASGSDWANTLMCDGFCQNLPQDNAGVDHQGFRPSIVFINGEYMGIHNIRSRMDGDFVEENQGLEPGTFDVINDDGIVEEGTATAFEEMDDLFNADLTVQANFDALSDVVDMTDFADYWATEIWTSNSSWGHNVVLSKGEGNAQWHYAFTDLDRGFSGALNDDIDGFTEPQDNGYDYARTWIRNALENDAFSAAFGQRFLDHLHTSFHPMRVSALIDEWSGQIREEIPYHVDRWAGTTSSYGDGIPTVEFWEEEIERMRTFAFERAPFIMADLADHLDLGAGVDLYTANAPVEAGCLVLNEFRLPEHRWTGPYATGMDFTLSAEAKPGHTFSGWSEAEHHIWVAASSAWKFDDSGTNLGTDWRHPEYDDSAWDSGQAEFGYGDGDEATTVSYGDDADDKHPTTYFRHTFEGPLDGAEDILATFKLRRDDAAVIYLNGQEAFRSNLRSGDIDFTTLALDFAGGVAEEQWNTHSLPITLLPGPNVLCVEVHQFSNTSSDISFDLELSSFIANDDIISTENPLPCTLSESSGFVARYEATGACLLPETIAEDLVLTIDCSPVLATGTSTVLNGATLTVDPGVEIWFPPETRLVIQGRLHAEGTAEAPIRFQGNPDDEAPWGHIQFDGTDQANLLRHVIVEGASDGPHPVHDRAAVTAWFSNLTLDEVVLTDNTSNPVYAEHSDIVMAHSLLHSDVTGDLINVRHGSGWIDHCTFIGNDQPDTDAIDYDVVDGGVVQHCIIRDFTGPNSDGIDLGEASFETVIAHNLIHRCSDKGISIGQASTAIIDDVTITECALGIAAKDQGMVDVNHTLVYGCGTALAAYQKNPGMGGGTIDIHNSILSNSVDAPATWDALSDGTVGTVLYDSHTLEAGGAFFANPLFSNPDSHDFTLLSGSPALGAADDGSDLGTTTFWDVNFRGMAMVEFGYAGLNAPNFEWIVLENEGSTDINLQGYHLDDGVEWVQIAPLWVAPGERIRLVKDPALFPDAAEPVIPWTSGQLSNQGERIVLRDASGIAVDHFEFLPQAPWPIPTPGMEALIRMAPELDNHFGSSWTLASTLRIDLAEATLHPIRLYPNPAEDRLTVANLSPNPMSSDIVITNSAGQDVLRLARPHSADLAPITTDISQLRPGLYVVACGLQRAKLIVR